MLGLTVNERAFSMALLKSGKSAIKVAQEMGVHRSAIYCLSLNVDMVGLEKGVKDKEGKESKKKSTAEQEALLLELVTNHPFQYSGQYQGAQRGRPRPPLHQDGPENPPQKGLLLQEGRQEALPDGCHEAEEAGLV